MHSCLLVEDELISLNILQEEFQAAGYEVTACADGEDAYQLGLQRDFDLVLLDMHLPHKSGMDILRAIRSHNSRSIVVIITAFGRIENAVEAMRAGADDYITKPYDMTDLFKKIDQLFDSHSRLVNIPNSSDSEPDLPQIWGKDDLTAQIKDVIRKVRDIDTTVLITGESGTGKGVVAKGIHYSGKYAKKPFVHINCAAVQPNLIESELFGYEKGAFTGAVGTKKGRFELAGDGTCFLDEIGTMPLNLQSKLLTVLQDRYFERVGGVQQIPLRARIIAATNEDLERNIKEGKFRLDLYYRLNVIRIEVPPLRCRRNDIIVLATSFINQFQGKLQKSIDEITDDFWDALLQYSWPGNIRELENVLEAAVALCDENILTSASLRFQSTTSMPANLSAETSTTSLSGSYKKMLNKQDSAIIAAALEKFDGHREKTARYLGISKRTLQYKLKQFNMLDDGS